MTQTPAGAGSGGRGGFRTKREAEAELNRQLHQVEQGADAFPSNMTLSDFANRWLEHQESRLRR